MPHAVAVYEWFVRHNTADKLRCTRQVSAQVSSAIHNTLGDGSQVPLQHTPRPAPGFPHPSLKNCVMQFFQDLLPSMLTQIMHTHVPPHTTRHMQDPLFCPTDERAHAAHTRQLTHAYTNTQAPLSTFLQPPHAQFMRSASETLLSEGRCVCVRTHSCVHACVVGRACMRAFVSVCVCARTRVMCACACARTSVGAPACLSASMHPLTPIVCARRKHTQRDGKERGSSPASVLSRNSVRAAYEQVCARAYVRLNLCVCARVHTCVAFVTGRSYTHTHTQTHRVMGHYLFSFGMKILRIARAPLAAVTRSSALFV